MTDSLPVPYKGRYTLAEFWPMLTRGALWRRFASEEGSPKEAAALDLHAKRKIAGEADVTPANLTHTYTGNAILMAILTLPA